MKKPCICDLKMGGNSKGTDPSANILKPLKQGVVQTITTSSTLGFRVVGMKVWDLEAGEYKNWGKFGTTVIRDMDKAMESFVSNGQGIRFDVLPVFISRCEEVIKWFKVQRDYEFLSSSILLYYDGEGERSDAKMIDFAHSFEKEVDESPGKSKVNSSYLTGMQNLCDILNRILDKKGD